MAKPNNWRDLPRHDRQRLAAELAGTPRGRLIVGQALARAVAAMRTDRYPETSNIEDMEMLGELFEPFHSMYARAGEAHR